MKTPMLLPGHAILLLLTLLCLTAPGSRADPSERVAACLETPQAGCAAVFTDRLSRLQTDAPPDLWPPALLDLKAQYLARMGALAEMRPLIAQMQSSAQKAQAARAAVAASRYPEDLDLAVELLAEISDHALARRTRGAFVDRVAETAGAAAARVVSDAIQRPRQSVSLQAERAVAFTLAREGQPDAAIAYLLDRNTAMSRGPTLADLVPVLLETGAFDAALTARDRIEGVFAEVFRATATAHIARYISRQWEPTDRVRALLEEAAEAMARESDPLARLPLFEELAAVAIEADEIALARQMARDAGTFPPDHAKSLLLLAALLQREHAPADWRPVVEDALELLNWAAWPSAEEPRVVSRAEIGAEAATLMALGGDPQRAVEILNGITLEDYRARARALLITRLLDTASPADARLLIDAQQDETARLLNWLALSRAALRIGHHAQARRAYMSALAEVDGPDAVVRDAAARLALARFEAERGLFTVARARIDQLPERHQRLMGQIVLLAQGPAAQDQTEPLADLRAAVLQTADPQTRAAEHRALVKALHRAGRHAEALAVAADVSETALRDEILMALGEDLATEGALLVAYRAARALTDRRARQIAETHVLLRARLADPYARRP
ncbi:hypothetical protein [uncultured Roseobacter sp.]|uniref:hypothetical protein n=1 Tax=uncultured Roseobacter sp. TaxID=114847 RepID=UPI00260BE658|nr:hypothetical protein [uncultured Roseobacter sp.]